MKCGILCGGKGLRFGKTEMPKVMALIGTKPILEHIIDHYYNFGVTDFVLLLGYKGKTVIDYFKKNSREYNIEFKDTGLDSDTGDRIEKAKNSLGDEFFLTYGDGISNINIKNLLSFHKSHNKLSTITIVYLPSQFGIVNVNKEHIVTQFNEKPSLKEHFINAGFFVFRNSKQIDFNGSLEKDVLPKLVKNGQLKAYHHAGFWRCMDTFKDYYELNKIWESKEGRLI